MLRREMSPPRDNIIEIRDLHFSRGTRKIFDGLNVDIKRGQVTAIMGPSGTGKTTLLRLITRQLRPDHGTILVDGVDIANLNKAQLYKLRKRFGMLFQNGALLTDLSVFENVAFPLREHTNLSNRLIRHVVLTKLHAVGLRGAADMMPGELSGGMARRVALARPPAARRARRRRRRLRRLPRRRAGLDRGDQIAPSLPLRERKQKPRAWQGQVLSFCKRGVNAASPSLSLRAFVASIGRSLSIDRLAANAPHSSGSVVNISG